MSVSTQTRQVAILLYPGVQSLDVTGPLEVFAGASQALAGKATPAYEVATVALRAEPLATSSGLTLLPGGPLPRRPLDTLIVPGGSGRRQALEEPALMSWLARAGARAGRLASVCTGAFLLAQAGQSQFSAALAAQEPSREPLREVKRLVVEEPAADHTVEAMAARAHMSPRHFARAFRAETGLTPARYVEQVRLEAARRRLEEGGQAVGVVATACGFGTAETMRRSFLRALGVSPADYRRRFNAYPTQSGTRRAA